MTEVTESTIRFPYKRSLGPVIGAFMTGAGRAADHRDPQRRAGAVPAARVGSRDRRGAAHHELRRGRPGRHGRPSWSWVGDPDRAAPARPSLRVRAHPARRRRHDAGARGRRRVDRRDGRRACGWRPGGGPTRTGHITDIAAFVPGEEPESRPTTAAPEEPVTMMDYDASITYRTPGHRRTPCGPSRPPPRAASSACGARCAGATYTGGKGYCPIDSIELTEEHEVDLPQTRRASRTTRSSRRSSTPARPRPSRSPGCTSCSTAPTW